MFLALVALWMMFVLVNPWEATQVGLAVLAGLYISNLQGVGKF